jgi:hypothetical protein
MRTDFLVLGALAGTLLAAPGDRLLRQPARKTEEHRPLGCTLHRGFGQMIVPQMWETLHVRGNCAWYGSLRIAAGLDNSEWEPGLLGGVSVVEGQARQLPPGDGTGLLYRTLHAVPAETVRIRLIPYYAWANRGLSHMSVWLSLEG